LGKVPAGSLLAGLLQPKTRDGVQTFSCDALKAFITRVEEAIPACCRCPYCHGDGHATNQRSCTCCRGAAFVGFDQWQKSPKPLRDRVIRDLAADQREAA